MISSHDCLLICLAHQLGSALVFMDCAKLHAEFSVFAVAPVPVSVYTLDTAILQ